MKVLACGKHDWYDSLPCPYCQPETTASYGHASDPTRYTDDDWRGKTCGECGWAHVWTGRQENFTCRRTGWMNSETGDGHSVGMSACPAFVPRKQP